MDPVTDELCPGLVADGSEPTVDTGAEPETFAPEGLPDAFESAPAGAEEFVDSDEEIVESDGEFPDPGAELDDSDELEAESESFGVANAAPIPPLPTNPTTPSEKATAPTRNAACFEFTYAPKRGRRIASTSANGQVARRRVT